MTTSGVSMEHRLGCQYTSPDIGGFLHINICGILKYIQRTVGFAFFSIEAILQMSIRACSQPYDDITSLGYFCTDPFVNQTIWSYINQKYILYRIISP